MKGAGLGNGERERLLDIDVFAHFEGGHGRDGVKVIRCGDDDRVDLVALGLEHLAPIRVDLCSREFLESPVGAAFIDITERINRLTRRGAAIEISTGPATRTDEGEIQLAVGGGALALHEAGEKVQ